MGVDVECVGSDVECVCGVFDVEKLGGKEMKFQCEIVFYESVAKKEVFDTDDEDKALVWLENRLNMVDRKVEGPIVEGRVMVEMPRIDGSKGWMVIRKEILNWRNFLVEGKKEG